MFISPMLLNKVDEPFNDNKFISELKVDGKVIDGEIIITDSKGNPSFESIIYTDSFNFALFIYNQRR